MELGQNAERKISMNNVTKNKIIKQHEHRILKQLAQYVSIESKEFSFNILTLEEQLSLPNENGKIFGVYINDIPTHDFVVISNFALHVFYEQNMATMPWNNILNVSCGDKKLNPEKVSIFLKSGETIVLNIRGNKLRNEEAYGYDSYEFARFLMRVIKRIKDQIMGNSHGQNEVKNGLKCEV